MPGRYDSGVEHRDAIPSAGATCARTPTSRSPTTISTGSSKPVGGHRRRRTSDVSNSSRSPTVATRGPRASGRVPRHVPRQGGDRAPEPDEERFITINRYDLGQATFAMMLSACASASAVAAHRQAIRARSRPVLASPRLSSRPTSSVSVCRPTRPSARSSTRPTVRRHRAPRSLVTLRVPPCDDERTGCRSVRLAANATYADGFGARSELALPPAPRCAILTCVGARLDPAKYAGLAEGDAHVIRNAGGRASDDAIRRS